MKKTLLTVVLALAATVLYAQDGLERIDGFYWQFNDADQTATIVSSYRWHSHGKKENGDDDMALGCCHCYSGDIVVPEKAPNGYTVTGIGKECFRSCSITSVKLPNTIKFIDDLAFELCKNLKAISIPASVEWIGYDCFGGSGIERVVIEDGDGIITIGHTAVYGSLFILQQSLRYVYVGRDFIVNNPNADETGGSKGLFHQCEQIEEIEFGSKVTTLHEGECSGCLALKKVTLSPAITVIPRECFGYCKSLVELQMSPDLTTIEDYAFQNCPNLPLNLADFTALKSIGGGAFMQSQVRRAVISAGVESVGNAAFGFNSELKELHCLAVVPPTCESSFGPVSEEMYKTCKLLVPEGSVDAYKAAEGWKNFYTIEATGITNTKVDDPASSEWYSICGQRLPTVQKGLNIQRMSDGSVRKVCVK